MGKSPGFFQVVAIDARPVWLMAMVGVFSTFGPITLAGYFITERYVKKNK